MAPNPMASSASGSPKPLSEHSYHIAGIRVTVHGLSSLPPPRRTPNVAVLWLLHPRLQTASSMAPAANAIINSWYGRGGAGRCGLLAVTFDQRNHGTRAADALANEAWRQGNARHAPDMFSIYQGTAADVSLLIGHLAGYVFPRNEYKMHRHMVLGVSLGGHAAWLCALHEPAIDTAVVVIGCPDYTRLMVDRAAKSKLPSYMQSNPPGAKFLGSADFPKSLEVQVEKYDPAGLLLGELDAVTGDDWKHEPSDEEKRRLYPIMRNTLGGKRVLCLSGGQDKLVPYDCSKPFLTWLKKSLTKENGWFSDRGTILEDVIDVEAGHEYTAKMAEVAADFVCRSLAADAVQSGGSAGTASTRSSKI